MRILQFHFSGRWFTIVGNPLICSAFIRDNYTVYLFYIHLEYIFTCRKKARTKRLDEKYLTDFLSSLRNSINICSRSLGMQKCQSFHQFGEMESSSNVHCEITQIVESHSNRQKTSGVSKWFIAPNIVCNLRLFGLTPVYNLFCIFLLCVTTAKSPHSWDR